MEAGEDVPSSRGPGKSWVLLGLLGLLGLSLEVRGEGFLSSACGSWGPKKFDKDSQTRSHPDERMLDQRPHQRDVEIRVDCLELGLWGFKLWGLSRVCHV